MGLPNSGKSSITNIIKNHLCPIDEDCNDQNAKAYDFDVLGTQVRLWNFEEAEWKRENTRYELDTITRLIYVLDIQNEAKYNQSISYLHFILQAIPNIDFDNFQIIMLFHKYDPNLAHNPQMVIQSRKLLTKVIKTIRSFPIVLKMFQTSVEEPFSLISCITQQIVEDEGLINILQNSLYSLAKKWHLPYISILTNQMIELTNYHKPQINFEEIQKRVFEKINKYSEALDILSEVETEYNNMIFNFSKFYLSYPFGLQPIFLIWSIPKNFPRFHDLTEDLYQLRESIKILFYNQQAVFLQAS